MAVRVRIPFNLAIKLACGLMAAFIVAISYGASIPAGATGSAESDEKSVRDTQNGLWTWSEEGLVTESVHGVGDMPALDDQGRAWFETAAEELGVPVEELIESQWRGESFNLLVDHLAITASDIFVSGARSDPEKTASSYDLVFTERPPQEILDRLRELPFDVDVKYGAPLSAKELDRARAVAQRVLTARFGDLFSEVKISPLGTAMRVTAKGGGLLGPLATLTEMSDAVKSSIATLPGGSSLRLDFAWDFLIEPPVNYVDMKAGFIYSDCTSGFAAINNGNRGLITAKHCADRPEYESTGIIMGPVVNASPNIDIQFNRAPDPHTSVPKFKINSSGTLYTVSAVANPVYGDLVSKYGKNTGQSTGYVMDANYCSPDLCQMFQVNLNAAGGDSGGPCYSAGTARGILQGASGGYTTCTRIGASPVTILEQ